MDKFNKLIKLMNSDKDETKFTSHIESIISDLNKNFSNEDNKTIINHLTKLKMAKDYHVKKRLLEMTLKEYKKLI